MNKPFCTKRTIIECSCGNNGKVVTQYGSVTLAKMCLHSTRQNLFNPKWLDLHGNKFPLDDKEKLMAVHLKQGHKLKVIPMEYN